MEVGSLKFTQTCLKKRFVIYTPVMALLDDIKIVILLNLLTLTKR